jgi:hypothetical protein
VVNVCAGEAIAIAAQNTTTTHATFAKLNVLDGER